MLGESQDQELAQALSVPRALPPAGLEARAVAAMREAGERRARRRQWLLCTSAAVAIVAIAFGSLAYYAANKPSAFRRRVLAAAEGATTLHSWGQEGTRDFETWVSDDGFRRRETRAGGAAVALSLEDEEGREIYYRPGGDEAGPLAQEFYDPTLRHLDSFLRPEDSPVTWAVWADVAVCGSAADRGQHQEVNGLGELVEVWEWECVLRDNCHIGDVACREGDRMWIRAEVDPDTGRLMSVTRYLWEGSWTVVKWAEYEWDAPIPEEAQDFAFPAGTAITRSVAWADLADQVIRTDATRDWQVTVHAMALNRHGDIGLWLSRVKTEESQVPRRYDSAPPLLVDAEGSSGERYTQSNTFSCMNAFGAGYWTTALRRDDPGPDPGTVTLTIWPYNEGVSEGQSVTFGDVPLPPREEVGDVFEARREVVQH